MPWRDRLQLTTNLDADVGLVRQSNVLDELDTHYSILDADEVRRITQGVASRPQEDVKYVDEQARTILQESAQEETSQQLQSWASLRSLSTTKLHEYSQATDLHRREKDSAILEKNNVLLQRDHAVAKQEELTAYFE